MRKSTPVVIACALATGLAPGATAHPTHHYRGGCEITAYSDGTDDAQTTWRGTARVSGTATDSTTSTSRPNAWIYAECDLYVDGVYVAVVVQASRVGTAENTTEVVYHADPTRW